jgi:predicted HAD superfamily Cof-like phosphohydrolase
MYKSNPAENPDLIQDVKNFNEKFEIVQRQIGTLVDKDRLKFRIRFLAEELKEINRDAAIGDLPGILDGLVDIVYVAIGAAYDLNLDFAGAWDNVQKANMAKVPASAENPSPRGHAKDVVKPKGWTPPNHDTLFCDEDLSHPAISEDACLVDLVRYMEA